MRLFTKIILLCTIILQLLPINFVHAKTDSVSNLEERLDQFHQFKLDQVHFSYKDLKLSASELEAIKKAQNEPLTFAVSHLDESYFYENDQHHYGSILFVYEALAKIFDLKNVQYKKYDYDTAYQKALNGEVDFIGPVPFSKDMGNVSFDATNRFYFNDWVLVSNKDQAIGEGFEFSQLSDQTIGYSPDFDFDHFIQSNMSVQLNTKVLPYEQMKQSLKNKEIDFYLTEYNQLSHDDLKELTYTKINDYLFIPQATIVSKSGEHKELIRAFSKALEYGLTDYLLQYSIYTNYIHTASLVAQDLTTEEINVLKKYTDQPIRIGADLLAPYLLQYEQGGPVVGHNSDLIQSIFRLIQFSSNQNVNFELVFDYKGLDETRQALDSNDLQFSILEQGTIDSHLLWSSPLFEQDYYVVRNVNSTPIGHLNNLDVTSFGLLEQATYLYQKYSNEYGLDSVIVYNSIEELTKALNDGTIQYAILPKQSITYLRNKELKTSILSDLSIGEKVYSAFAFSNSTDGIILQSVVNKVLRYIDFSTIGSNSSYVETDFGKIISLEKSSVQQTKLLFYGSLFVTVLLMIISLLFYKMNHKYRNLVEYDGVTKLKTLHALSHDYEDFSKVGIIYIRIENESHLNRIYGYDYFNKILYKFSSKLNSIARHHHAPLYRTGGKSFCLILPASKKDQAENIIQEIAQLNTVKTNFGEMSLHLVIGAYTENFAFDTIKELLVFIQTAVRKVANNKYQKDRIIQIDDDSIQEYMNHRYQIIDIENAIQSNSFIPVFQPQIDITNNQIIGMEVLARWNKNGTLVAPFHFIKPAEDANLIGEIEIQVATKSIQFLRYLLDHQLVDESFVLSINLSPKTILHDAESIQNILDLIRESNIPSHYFKVEITEEGLKDIPGLINECINLFNNENIKVALDDFSAGDSSLITVSQFSFDTIKIDRQLLLEKNVELKKLTLKFIKEYATILNRNIIVEGVETEEDVQILKDLKIYQAQGFFFSKPLEEKLFIDFCRNWNKA